MNDLIYRQAAIDTIKDADVCVCYSENESVEIEDVIDLAIRATKGSVIASIEQMPSADAVPVIRCKDCRYSDWYTTYDGVRRCYCMEHGSAGHTEKDFCSYAERETDE